MSVKKRFIPVSEDIVFELGRIAERVGIPIPELTERILKEITRAFKYRGDILKMLVNVDAVEDLRRLGCVVLPSNVTFEVVDNLDENAFNRVVEELKRSAAWYGELAKVKRGKDVDEFVRVLSLWLPIANIDVVELGDGRFKVVVSIFSRSNRLSKIAEVIIRELLKALEYNVIDFESRDGVIVTTLEE